MFFKIFYFLTYFTILKKKRERDNIWYTRVYYKTLLKITFLNIFVEISFLIQ